MIGRQAKAFARSARDMLQGRQIVAGDQVEEFWALKDVSFEIKRGEITAVIGNNGAGKSTLLKILSRITEPTAGRVMLRGRVASLLEVGTGFHPELTGRENVYLNGAILGMSRHEIRRKFDEIVAFAEVEKFLDTAVKRYSSGMYVRLAFAVAAHLEPEILIVDEVLAVGDAAFQEKCLRHLKTISRREHITILLVTHNLNLAQRICPSALMLANGSISCRGDVQSVIEKYAHNLRSMSANTLLAQRTDRTGNQAVAAARFQVIDENGTEQIVLRSGNQYTFAIQCKKRVDVNVVKGVNACIELKDERGATVWLACTEFAGRLFEVTELTFELRCRVNELALAPGAYSVTIFIGRPGADVLDCVHNAETLRVESGDFFGTGHPGHPDVCKTLTRAEWWLEPHPHSEQPNPGSSGQPE